MTVTVDGTYQRGKLKLKKPIDLADGTPVRITITTADEDYDPLQAVIGIGQSGRTDGADQHDHYIYDARKR